MNEIKKEMISKIILSNIENNYLDGLKDKSLVEHQIYNII